MANSVRKDSKRTVGENVSEKSSPGTCEKPWATNLALNLSSRPVGVYLTVNTHLDPTGLLPSGRSANSQVSSA